VALQAHARGAPRGARPLARGEHAAPRARRHVTIDRGEREAHRFGALTSGAVVVYAPSGDLVFEGGLTIARGHEGGAAPERIRDLVTANATSPLLGPVFGCGLDGPVAESRR
jgi:hypothetical protein